MAFGPLETLVLETPVQVPQVPTVPYGTIPRAYVDIVPPRESLPSGSG